ncbi:MAG: YheT family hydrolase, partial [Alphaproteobacteria bacterium]
LIHGMSGSENSSTIKKSAQFYLEQGFPTLRLNLRGAGAFRKSARGTYHAGRSEDLGEVLSQLNANLADQCFLVGHSLGGNMLIKAVSEIGVKINSNIPILGAASLCAPFNMVESAVKFSRRRNYVYQNSIFSHIKASLSSVDGISERQLERIHAFKTLRELDDTVVAPSLGLSDAKQYYEKYSACKFAADAKVPLLISTALDDPWVCAKAYLDFDWSQNSNLIPAITKTGGHCGFHEKGHTSTWFDRRVAQLIDTLS